MSTGHASARTAPTRSPSINVGSGGRGSGNDALKNTQGGNISPTYSATVVIPVLKHGETYSGSHTRATDHVSAQSSKQFMTATERNSSPTGSVSRSHPSATQGASLPQPSTEPKSVVSPRASTSRGRSAGVSFLRPIITDEMRRADERRREVIKVCVCVCVCVCSVNHLYIRRCAHSPTSCAFTCTCPHHTHVNTRSLTHQQQILNS